VTTTATDSAAPARQRLRAAMCVLLAAALFSTGGAAIKAVDLTSWQISTFRSGIATLALLLFAREARSGWTVRTLPVGLAYAATVLLFVTATRLTTSANAIFLQSTAPLYILLLSPWLLRERITRGDVAFMLAVGAGLALFFIAPSEPRSTAPDPATGDVVALCSGLSFACLVMGMRWLGSAPRGAGAGAPGSSRRGDGGLPCVVLGNALAFALGLPFVLAGPGPFDVSAGDWGVLLFLGCVQIGLAYVLLVRGLRHVPAFEASVLLLAEPALNRAARRRDHPAGDAGQGLAGRAPHRAARTRSRGGRGGRSRGTHALSAPAERTR
jgi:drug/metabolite transporter, DME family